VAKEIMTEDLSIATIAGGAVIEALDYEFQRVFDNIVDPNTKAESARTLTLQVKIKPDKSRSKATITFLAKAGLQPAEAVESDVYITDKRGKAVVVESQPPVQHELPVGDNVSPFVANGEKE